jgi:hypothetical protein
MESIMAEASSFEKDLLTLTGTPTINQRLQSQLLKLLNHIERINIMAEDPTVPADQGIADITTQMRHLINRILP